MRTGIDSLAARSTSYDSWPSRNLLKPCSRAFISGHAQTALTDSDRRIVTDDSPASTAPRQSLMDLVLDAFGAALNNDQRNRSRD